MDTEKGVPLDVNYQEKDISVVIVTWNSRKWIEKCLKSLFNSLNGLKSEVFVVDNNSTDKTVEFIRDSFPKVKIIKKDRNFGFGEGNNVGISQSSGKHILLLNPDTEVNCDAIQSMINFLEAHPSVGAVGPEQRNEFNKIIFTYSKFSIRGLFEYLIEKLYELIYRENKIIFKSPHQVLFLNLGCVMFRREIFDQGIHFDPNLFLYGEELDLFTKIRVKGWKVFFLRNKFIYHFREKSISLINRKNYFVLSSHLKVLKKFILRYY